MQKLITLFFFGWTASTNPAGMSSPASEKPGNGRPGNFESMMNPLTLI